MTTSTWCPRERRFLWTDYAFNLVFMGLTYGLFGAGVLPVNYAVAHALGMMHGAVWETFNAVVPRWLKLVDPELERNHCKPLYVLAHTASDGMLTMAGYAIVRHAFSDPWLRSSRAAVTFWCLMNLQAVAMELLFNGKVWEYGTSFGANPTLWRRTITRPNYDDHPDRRPHRVRVGYTLWPQAVWWVTGCTFPWAFAPLLRAWHVSPS